MNKAIKKLAISKLSGYIGGLFYLGFIGGAFINEWLAITSLCLAIIAVVVKLFFEVAFTYEAFKNE